MVSAVVSCCKHGAVRPVLSATSRCRVGAGRNEWSRDPSGALLPRDEGRWPGASHGDATMRANSRV